MKCRNCGRSYTGVCTNCEDHLFDQQIVLTARNPGVPRLLEERHELQEMHEKCEESREQLIHRIIGLTICISIAMALGAYVVYLKIENKSLREPPNPPNERVGLMQLEPNGHVVAKNFSVKGQSVGIDIKVSAECENCDDSDLAMMLLNDLNYERFELNRHYDPIYEEVDRELFGFDGDLEEGDYHIVFQNNSNSRWVIVNIGVDVHYK